MVFKDDRVRNTAQGKNLIKVVTVTRGWEHSQTIDSKELEFKLEDLLQALEKGEVLAASVDVSPMATDVQSCIKEHFTPVSDLSQGSRFLRHLYCIRNYFTTVSDLKQGSQFLRDLLNKPLRESVCLTLKTSVPTLAAEEDILSNDHAAPSGKSTSTDPGNILPNSDDSPLQLSDFAQAIRRIFHRGKMTDTALRMLVRSGLLAGVIRIQDIDRRLLNQYVTSQE
ncbi:hypothetical protein IWQ61_009321 [Dispira simplex]|nr:hypothetical protein IWQ61_009321 [Dispira simplex]